ncbi:hypothetical protein [Geminicoccus flavidas]|uniref:hypothetical protein n=1 Tax=Geminicoccus flavidas TaxID=2506407 RepID=UPI0013579B5B|nr:hypothetical protein [Geminicoccus flavidas]
MATLTRIFLDHLLVQVGQEAIEGVGRDFEWSDAQGRAPAGKAVQLVMVALAHWCQQLMPGSIQLEVAPLPVNLDPGQLDGPAQDGGVSDDVRRHPAADDGKAVDR